MQQRRPRGEAEQRRTPGENEDAGPGQRAGRGDRIPDGRTAFERVREQRQRQRRYQARPDDQREHVRLVRARRVLGDHVADRPREGGDDHQHKADEGRFHAARQLECGKQDDAHTGDRRTDQIVPLQPVAEKGDREADGEKHLQLDDQRRQSRRHAELDGQERESELHDADRQAVAGDVAARASAAAG